MKDSSSPLLSIIIPTLNEAENILRILDDLKKQQYIAFEIIVGDGGSTDATKELAAASGAVVYDAKRGRGAQMNAAAALASGEYLLFMHADSRVDDPALLYKAVCALMSESADRDRIAGHFRLRFIRTINRNALTYRYIEEKSALNRVGTTNGDQGLLLTKVFFELLGGFDESLPFLEDQRIAAKIRSMGKWVTLPGYLMTSARRFEAEGFCRRYILMSMMMGMNTLGEKSFFVRAPGIYRAQHETTKLKLSPYFNCLWHIISGEWKVQGTIRNFYLLGRYILQNSWQLFFFLDVCFRTLYRLERYPLLDFHDRLSGTTPSCKLFDLITGAICFIWFMGLLWPFFRLKECWDTNQIN